MSQAAEDLIELKRLADSDEGHAGALTEHLLRTLALNIIAPGVNDQRAGL